MKLGSFVCPVEDKDHEAVAIIVSDHSKHGSESFTIKWLSDGHISLRDKADLKELTPLEFCKSWCKHQIGY